jgi:DNA invertase Pin-like site-specific DNA recombinase
MNEVTAYLRVSTDRQDSDNQRYEIERFCKEKGLEVIEWVVDESVSGKVKADKRKLGGLIDRMEYGSTLIVTEISRIGRDWFDILSSINELMVNGVHVIAIKNGYELKNDAMGKLFVSIMAVFAEEERKLLSERVKMALAKKKKDGVILGRRKGRKTDMNKRKLDSHRDTILRLIEDKVPKKEIVHRIGTNRVTLNKYLKDIAV